MSTSERLQQFYDFDQDILARVEQVAHDQRQKSFAQLADQYGIAKGAQWTYPFFDERAVDFYYFKPKQDFDETKLRVYRAPMANPADTNMAMRAIRLFAADPSEPLMVLGNPAAIGLRKHRILRQNLKTVWNGDLAPAVEPAVEYIQHLGVKRADFIGYSYGAEASPVEAAVAKSRDIVAERGVWIEPAAVVQRSLVRLALSFGSTGGDKLKDAVERTGSEALNEARDIANVGMVRWGLGMLRASNLAIAHSMTMPRFVVRAEQALAAQPTLKATVGWGEQSELAVDENMQQVIERLEDHYAARVGHMALRGMNHAGGDDIDLHAAMVLQGLRGPR